MIRLMKLTLISLLITFAGHSIADGKCQSQPWPLPEHHFIDLYQQALILGKAICESYGEDVSPELHQQYLHFANHVTTEVKKAFLPLDSKTLPAFFENLERFPALASRGINKNRLPQFTLSLIHI